MTQPFTYVQFEEDRLHSVRAFVWLKGWGSTKGHFWMPRDSVIIPERSLDHDRFFCFFCFLPLFLSPSRPFWTAPKFPSLHIYTIEEQYKPNVCESIVEREKEGAADVWTWLRSRHWSPNKQTKQVRIVGEIKEMFERKAEQVHSSSCLASSIDNWMGSLEKRKTVTSLIRISLFWFSAGPAHDPGFGGHTRHTNELLLLGWPVPSQYIYSKEREFFNNIKNSLQLGSKVINFPFFFLKKDPIPQEFFLFFFLLSLRELISPVKQIDGG